jgi:hypothetical protein
MIKIDYREDGIRVEGGNLLEFFTEDMFPLRVEFQTWKERGICLAERK